MQNIGVIVRPMEASPIDPDAPGSSDRPFYISSPYQAKLAIEEIARQRGMSPGQIAALTAGFNDHDPVFEPSVVPETRDRIFLLRTEYRTY